MTPEEFWSFNSTAKAQKTIARIAETIGANPKALRILFNTQWDLDGREGAWIEYSEVPEKDLEYGKSAGLLQESFELDHRSMISRIVKARGTVERRAVAAAFASSFFTRRMDMRSALGSYAHSLHLAAHRFDPPKGAENCRLCDFPRKEKVPVNHYTFRRIMWAGNVYQGNLGYVLCDLEAFGNSNSVCGKAEKMLLDKMFSSIRRLPNEAGLSDLDKSISGLFPGNKHERRVVLEILGYCGIIKPKNCPSMHLQWVPRCDLPVPTHFYRKEWRSPVSCWTGADGIHDEAIDFWFGDF